MSNKFISFLTVFGILVVSFVIVSVFAITATPGEPVANQHVVCSSERSTTTPADVFKYVMTCKPY